MPPRRGPHLLRLAALGPICLGLTGCPRPLPHREDSVRAPARPAPATASVPAGTGAAPRPPPATERAGHEPAAPPAQAAALFALGETDPRAALLAAEESELGGAALHVCGILLQRWAERDFLAALDHAERRPAGPAREELLARLALVLAEGQPAEAARMIAHDLAAGPARDEAALSVLHRWLRADPAGAAAWVRAFPPGSLRERALREVAGSAASAAP